jgi:hypothetical protein
MKIRTQPQPMYERKKENEDKFCIISHDFVYNLPCIMAGAHQNQINLPDV